MLRQEIEEQLAEVIVDRIEEANAYILEKIGNSIKQFSDLSVSQAYQLAQILKYGGSYEEIAKELAKASGKNVKDIYKIFEEVAKNNKQFAKKFYNYRGIDYIPYKKDTALQNLVESIGNITSWNYMNIARTSGIGFLFEDLNGQIMFKNIEQAYNEVVDRAVLSLSQGKTTFQEEMTRIMRQMGNNGLVLYDSGRTRRLDSAVRMSVLDGIRQINIESSKRFGAEYGADGVEISVHTAPAPDHADIQGRQFSNEQYDLLENGFEAEDVKHHTYNGADKRHIGELNCYHKIFAIVLGISEPEYSDEELKQIQEDNEKGFDFDGKHYTLYEGTQLQRKIELEIRKQKDTQILGKASGFSDIVKESQDKIKVLTDKYKELSKVSGLKMKPERMRVSGYRRMKV